MASGQQGVILESRYSDVTVELDQVLNVIAVHVSEFRYQRGLVLK